MAPSSTFPGWHCIQAHHPHPPITQSIGCHLHLDLASTEPGVCRVGAGEGSVGCLCSGGVEAAAEADADITQVGLVWYHLADLHDLLTIANLHRT